MVLTYETEPSDIEHVTSETIQSVRNLFDQILNVKDGSWLDVFGRFSDGLAKIHNRLWLSELMVRVGAKPETRKAYAESSSKLKQLRTQTFADPSFYSVLSSHRHLRAPAEEGYNPNEDLKFMKDVLLQFERNGCSLPTEKLEAYRKLSSRLSDVEGQFNRAVGEDLSHIIVKREDLVGLSEDFIENLKRVDGGEGDERIVTMKYPDVLPVLKKAKKEETRRRARACMDNRAGFDNMKKLKEAILLRGEIARVLGYKSWAEYRLEVKLPRTPERVVEFSEQLAEKLKSLSEKEMKVLLDIKREDKEKEGEKFDGKLHGWDSSFYMNKFLERDYGLDEEQIRGYFPIDHVTKEILSTYETLLGLKFTELTQKHPEALWDESVKLYRVEEKSDGEFVGHFYLDLIPRDGKYSHACAYPVIDGLTFFHDGPSTTRQHPIAVMIANFTRPTASKPSLLNHSEIKTYCHEFGHVMHNICSKVRHSENTWLFAGMDFIECPSQMMENFIWQKDVLKRWGEEVEEELTRRRISKHYERGEPMSDGLIDKIIASKNVGIGMSKLQQAFMGLYDIKIHSLDTDSLFPPNDDGSSLSDLWMTGMEAVPGTHYVSSWLHLCSDYDAGYYSYLWSEVFSSDLFSRFQAEGILSPKVGEDYRRLVLQPAASEDGMKLLGDFLGRAPNQESFLKSLGLN
ncbi:hypothetical protein PROFUN_02146 [Planoprotostelium fungivorum]|uniref:Peptidase M3A/M3B catalytic domain-containing protein n=1 Tax=Planoprotostelium fungivorum TaxID=1890364 RepID=A0A2P6NZ94_9EUKA|nr:hypothetical protein PROFUN_02146 [Planoprotostelium fungivorum]